MTDAAVQTESDQELLDAFIARRDEGAFSEIVRRHVRLVFSAAMRQTREREMAQDVTQAVFLLLSQNARKVRGGGAALPGWLYNTTRYACANAIR